MILGQRNILLVCISLILISLSTTILSDPLKRRAQWGGQFKGLSNDGITLTKISKNSPLDKAGLQSGDVVFSIDSTKINQQSSWYDLTDALVSGKNYRIGYRRNQQEKIVEITFPPVPKENYEGIKTVYSSFINANQIRQRVITTHPETSNNQQPVQWPAIFVVQGLSCSSIESTPGRKSNFIRILRDLVQHSEMLVMRVEKPGLGDSEGNCSQTDFHQELQGYEQALQQLLARPDVDAKRVIIYGNSMGSALAPYLANKYQLNGVISDGPFFRSWFEHMLEIERRIKLMQGRNQSEVQHLMNSAYIPLYYGMLIEKKSYADVIKEKPALAKHNYHGDAHMYGRPVSYYHQIQDFDFEGQWAQLSTPARVRWGTYDWIMSESDIDSIAQVLKASNSNFEVFKYPLLDHWATLHESPSNSFHGKKGRWEDNISGQIIHWAKELNSQSNNPPK